MGILEEAPTTVNICPSYARGTLVLLAESNTGAGVHTFIRYRGGHSRCRNAEHSILIQNLQGQSSLSPFPTALIHIMWRWPLEAATWSVFRLNSSTIRNGFPHTDLQCWKSLRFPRATQDSTTLACSFRQHSEVHSRYSGTAFTLEIRLAMFGQLFHSHINNYLVESVWILPPQLGSKTARQVEGKCSVCLTNYPF